MADILADECVDMQLVFRLRRLGHDVKTVREICESKYGDGIEDPQVLQYARECRRAVLTINESDFKKLHGSAPWHHGILICEIEKHVLAQARRIDDELKKHRNLRGKLVMVTRAATVPPKSPRRKRRLE